ncbi:hypothetical protein OIDMADRAFT_200587 [Oidiodendron maius Zn]|uniref:Phosphatidylinositol transfer protein SFH5 n=1 Tax=Oidiodendron maius (strain Zn) TaxID=913774 RepID=A0A0C3HB02_OIDMZ|nr:hypothetical protein OIDMADRAFT_200587 [Oidiodendron maius Zn]
MWGVELSDESHVPSTIVLEKFLRANNKDVAKAKSQLTSALKWRKRVQPAKLLEETEFDPVKFGGLGYVTIYPKSDKHEKEILTWNIYGAAKNVKATFGNVDEFINWRAALMELSVKELDLPSATEKIPENGADPYRMVQVHDYLNISFFRMDSSVKAASKETIEVFSMAYPELLKEKFFVNVPLVMGWVFAAMKIFLSPDTIKKFHPLSYGGSLAGELKPYGQELPPAYGGKGKDIKEGLTVKYAAVEVQDTAPVATEAPAKAEDSKEASAEAADKNDTPAEIADKKDAPAEAEEKKKAPAETEEKKEAPDATEDKKDAPAEEEDKKDTPAETGEAKDVLTEAAEKSTAVEATA